MTLSKFWMLEVLSESEFLASHALMQVLQGRCLKFQTQSWNVSREGVVVYGEIIEATQTVRYGTRSELNAIFSVTFIIKSQQESGEIGDVIRQQSFLNSKEIVGVNVESAENSSAVLLRSWRFSKETVMLASRGK